MKSTIENTCENTKRYVRVRYYIKIQIIFTKTPPTMEIDKIRGIYKEKYEKTKKVRIIYKESTFKVRIFHAEFN